jgi:hypothetical protein
MGQIDSPFKGKTPTLINKEENTAFYGETRTEQVINYKPTNPHDPRSGVYPVAETVEVPVSGETIDLRTGQSNSKYWEPEMVVNPQGCMHDFTFTSVGKREIECSNGCGFETTFHPGINYKEEGGRATVILKGVRYPLH